jgi:GMP reductase
MIFKFNTFQRKLKFSDVMIKPIKSNINSRKSVNLNVNYKFKHSGRTWEGVPLICSNMDSISNDRMYNELNNHGIMSCLNKHIDNFDTFFLDRNTYMFSTGITDKDIKKIDNLIDHYNPHFVCIDVANGYMDQLLYTIDNFHSKHHSKNITLCVGNVITPERVEELINNYGVDIVKLGIGSGGVCTTSTKTGIGCPQLSVILDSYEAAKNAGGYIISDGGIKVPGDIAKAFAAGADFVMLGSILSGHFECDGQIIQKEDGLYMKFYGMSSRDAMIKHFGSINSYRTDEGKTILVPIKGQVKDTISDIFGSLRSTCTYINADSISQIYENSTFIIV